MCFFANNSACHSPQANFVNNLERMDFISIHLHPFYKEELSNINEATTMDSDSDNVVYKLESLFNSQM